MNIFWQDEKLPLKRSFFGPKSPRFLEIGFGKGDFLIHLFALDSSSPLVGIEISREMINITLRKLGFQPNLFLFQGDAKFLLKYVLPYFTFEKIFMLFPFPWPKEKHKERRIYEGDFPEIIWYSLKNDGKFYVVTDAEFFYKELKQRFLKKNLFSEAEFEDFFKEKAIETKYARKWRKEGKNFYFVCFKKINENKPELKKKIKILNKIDHMILASEKFKSEFQNTEEEKIFILKRVFLSDKGKIFELFVREENFEQFLYLLMEKKKNIILRPLFREKIVFTEWIMKNLKNIFEIKCI